MLKLVWKKTILLIAAAAICWSCGLLSVVALADDVVTENQEYKSLTTNNLSKEDDLSPIELLKNKTNEELKDAQVSRSQHFKNAILASPLVQEAQYKMKLEAIVSYADAHVGNPYVWGGNSLTKGCDCSHFVWLVLRDTIGYAEGYATSRCWLNRGTVVSSLADAQAGDVIVYSGHVALYDGQGYLIEALNRRKGIVHNRTADCATILGIRRFV